MAQNANFAEVGGAFTKHYYSLFDTDRSQLAPLYRDQSMLTFEGNQFQGTAAIVEKLVGLPFQKVAHAISTIDSQPVPNGGILVTVSGNLVLDDEANSMKFAQTFQLIPDGSTFYVLNDIFRLNLS